MTNTDYIKEAIIRMKEAMITGEDRERYGITKRFAIGYNKACGYAISVLNDLQKQIGGDEE